MRSSNTGLSPASETVITLAELVEGGVFVDGDWVESKDQDPNGEVRLIQLADIGEGVFRDRSSRFLTLAKARELRCTFLEPGDILVARMPEPLGRACIFPGVGQPAVTAVDVCIVRPEPNRASPAWLVKVINSPSFRGSMQEFVRGTTRQRISRRNLGSLRLAVPDLNVQTEVASFVDEVESRRGSEAGHVIAGRQAIDYFRQAVLAAACSGRLTADWRENNVSTVSDDLVSTVTSDIADAIEIPASWVVAHVGDIGTVQLGGTPSRKRTDYWSGSVPWISSGEVANCRITSTRETISDHGLANSSAKLYPPGTVLIAMIGEGKTRGQAAILDIEAATNQNAAGIIANRRFVDPEYLWRWALAVYETTRAAGTGGNQPALNKQRVADLIAPIPPLDEQAEIVRRVDHLLGLASVLRARIDVASKRLGQSAQAILANVFRSDLDSSVSHSTGKKQAFPATFEAEPPKVGSRQ